MSEKVEQPGQSPYQIRRPGLTLNSRSLTLLFAIVLLCPLTLIALLIFTLPAAHDKPLSVKVDLIREQGKSPAVRITNVGEVSLQSLRIELNGAFAFFPQAPLPPKEDVDLSLEWFMKKTGQHLDPAATEIRTIHISARLPGNQRAVMTSNL